MRSALDRLWTGHGQVAGQVAGQVDSSVAGFVMLMTERDVSSLFSACPTYPTCPAIHLSSLFLGQGRPRMITRPILNRS